MLPVISLEIPSYSFFAFIGAIFVYRYIFNNRKNIGINCKDILLYFLICIVFCFIGARLMFVISLLPSNKIKDFNSFFEYLVGGGIVFYGGMLGTLLGIDVTSKIIKKESSYMLDSFAPAIPLFHGTARIGCLFAGCCYGIPFLVGVIMQGENIIRFPVQFIEAICNYVIFFILIKKNKKKQSVKGNLYFYLKSYALCRFILEFFRGDAIRGIWFPGLSTAQYVSLIIIVFLCVKKEMFKRKRESVVNKEF